MQTHSPKNLNTCNHMTSLYPLEKQFINVTFMQGIWNINPNQDQFTSSVRPSTGLARKENKAYLNFLLVPIIPIPMLMLKICPSNLIKIFPTNQKNQNTSPQSLQEIGTEHNTLIISKVLQCFDCQVGMLLPQVLKIFSTFL